MTDGE